mmetsp:Transcript_5138/g.8895  ORF Transcript_5138/g.8895 Transcript_5138/m.8895 type:complete len:223 (-) Transcript_5138:70-738(-)
MSASQPAGKGIGAGTLDGGSTVEVRSVNVRRRSGSSTKRSAGNKPPGDAAPAPAKAPNGAGGTGTATGGTGVRSVCVAVTETLTRHGPRIGRSARPRGTRTGPEGTRTGSAAGNGVSETGPGAAGADPVTEGIETGIPAGTEMTGKGMTGTRTGAATGRRTGSVTGRRTSPRDQRSRRQGGPPLRTLRSLQQTHCAHHWGSSHSSDPMPRVSHTVSVCVRCR